TWSSEPDARPVYFAIKGGNVAGAETGSSPRPEDVLLHAQADAGSFIIDGARRRWIMDLGPDDYDLPGYFDHGADNRSGLRWRYYRTQTAGHNTLVIDGRNQIPNARAPIVGSCIDGECKWAVFDLSAAYDKAPGAVLRGAALIGRQVVIQDEVDPEVSGTIAWIAHTTAEPVSVAGSVARFRSASERFVVGSVEPSRAVVAAGFPPRATLVPHCRRPPIARPPRIRRQQPRNIRNAAPSRCLRPARGCVDTPAADSLAKRRQATYCRVAARL